MIRNVIFLNSRGLVCCFKHRKIYKLLRALVLIVPNYLCFISYKISGNEEIFISLTGVIPDM